MTTIRSGWIFGIADDGPDGRAYRAYLETTAPPVHRIFVGCTCVTRENAEAELERYMEATTQEDLAQLEVLIRSKVEPAMADG